MATTIGPSVPRSRRRLAGLALCIPGLLAVAAPVAAQGGGTTLCHATGNPAHPYISLTVGPEGPGPHGVHEGDLIPAPAGGCPTAEAAATPTPAPTATPEATPAPVATPDAVPVPEERTAQTVEGGSEAEADDNRSRRRRARRDRQRAPRPQAAPQPAIAVAAPVPAPVAARTYSARATLPRTGNETLIMTMAGLGLLMMGAGLRVRQHGAGA